MQVCVLGTYGYREPSDTEWNDLLSNPSWEDIEAALRRLNAEEYEGVLLHLNDHRAGEPATDYLGVFGGPAGYLVLWTRPGAKGAVLVDSTQPKGQEPVPVAQHDQGIWVSPRQVCRDLELIVQVARYFADTGQRLPSSAWE
jgi:hypothetical protein